MNKKVTVDDYLSGFFSDKKTIAINDNILVKTNTSITFMSKVFHY